MIRVSLGDRLKLSGLLIAFSGSVFFQLEILEASVVPGLSSGKNHVIHLRSDGTLWGWGDNSLGQLGNGTTESVSLPVQISSDTDWKEVSSGALHCIAVKADGTLWAWGDNSHEQLGVDTVPFSLIPRQVGEASDWFHISSGGSHNLGIRQDGSLWAWGSNSSGQLGDGTLINRSQPVRVGQGVGWTSISAGASFSAAIQFNRSLWTWGDNEQGQLGVGHLNKEIRPIQVGDARDWIQAVAGENHMLAVNANGKLFSWGDNEMGQLGVGELKQQAIYENLTEFSGVFFATRDEYGDEVRLEEDNEVISEFLFDYFGNFASNLKGTAVFRIYANDGPLLNNGSPTPQTLLFESNVVSISSGENTLAFLGLSVQVPKIFTWTVKFDLPVPVEEGRVGLRIYDPPLIGVSFDDYWRKMETGWKLFRFPEQDFRANFGALVSKQVRIDRETLPVAVSGGRQWKSFAAGTGNSAAVAQDDSLWAWGSDSLNSPDPTDVLIRFNPIQIGEEMDWSFVSAGDGFNIGSRTDLSLWSWGNNGFGQLGGGDQAYRGEPGLIDLDFIPHPPVITSAPKSLLMDLGKNAVFQVNVLGPGSIHYQWYHDGIPLEGATESILQVNRVQLENGGDYRVAVSNEYGEITSSSASLTVVDRVQITRHPENQTVPFGAEVSFYVEADFIGNVQYEWRLSGRLIPDSNDPVLMLDKVSTQDEGRYTVRIRNEAGVAVSKEAVLTVLSPPVIISGPSSREIERADNIFLSVFAIGAFPLQHQWFKDGVPIPDANSSLLSLRGVQESDEGVYSVRVENVAGAVTSFPAQILVNQAPVIGEQPVDLIVDAGQSARFSVQPQKGVSLKYQWFFNEIEIPGTAGNSFTLQSVTYEDVGNYSVRIQNSIGFVESRNASLKIKELPGISPTEETSIVSVGSQVVWEVHPESKFPVSYQWFFNNELLSRQTSSRLELQNLSRENAGTYYVRISNEFGSIDGPLMNLVVVNASGPGRIASGETVDFEVEVFGAPDAVVQLRRNGMPLIPQPDASFRIENITLQDSGLYQVSIQAFQAARTIDLARLRVIGEFLRFSNQFEDRIALDPAGGIGQTYMIRAGRESGEPDHAGKMGGRSIWYSWKASANGMAFLKTLGSELDTRIAVYRGEGLTELTPVVSDDDSGGFFSSVVEFPVQQDEVFAIAVAHGERRNGRIVLEWGISDVLLNQGANLTGRSAASALPPTSPEASSLIHYGKFSDAASFLLAEGLDESAVPVRLPGDEDRIVFSNLGSSVEFGEPLHCNQIGGASKWMVFRVGEASWTTVEATGQQFGTVAAVYELTRDEFKDLSLIVCSPPGSTDRPVSKIGFQARPGNYYALVVDSLASASDEIEVELQFEASKHFSIIPTDLDSMRNETVEFLLQPELEEGDQIEWVKNGVVLPDREQSLLKLSNLLLRDTGIYQARITTTAGVVLTSATSSLKVSDLLVIDDQPDDIRAVIGSSAAFSILARGEGSLNYQWTLNGEELAGADTARLAFGPALPENEGVYQVLVTDRNGSLLSNTVELDILHPAKILSQSSGSGAGAGNEVILAVEFEGSPPHRIEWFYQGNLIPGAVESELVLPDFQREDAGDYQVVISSAGSEAVSPPINVSFRGKPEVLVHPISMEIPEDAAAFFSVSASGKGPFAYQWFLNDELLIGEIRADLYVPDAGISNQGLYRVNVSNPGGSVLSLPADLSILMAPEITVPPLGFAVNAGDLVLLHVEALGSPVLEYQWFVDGSPIQGAQESLLIFTASGISQGSYQVMVSNRVGFAKSAEVDLVVAQPLVIIKQPLAKVVLEGDSVSFSVEVTGQRPFVFQWFKNGLPIENATQNVLEMSSVVLSDVADYSVSIFNESGSVTSQVALLAIQRLSRIRIADFFSEFGLNILTLEWNSLPGRTYQVDVSTDLLTWEPLSNLTAFAKLTQIVDILNAAQLIRFYRLTEVP